jgi:hypothetical protein
MHDIFIIGPDDCSEAMAISHGKMATDPYSTAVHANRVAFVDFSVRMYLTCAAGRNERPAQAYQANAHEGR